MDAIEAKYDVLSKALDSLYETLSYFDKVRHASQKQDLLDTYEIVYKSARDSVIQRFEYSIELFWKYMRLYLENAKKIRLASNTPRDVIRAATLARIISEGDAEICMDMIESRNLTSHIYKEDVAQQLALVIPNYYEHMKILVGKLSPE